jgi:hypothetical protein
MASRNRELLSNDDILRSSRRSRECVHRQILQRRFIRYPLTLPSSLPLAFVTYDHLQDICNKPTAIYWTSPDRCDSTYLEHYIYDKWSRGNIHSTDVEFSRFFAKLVAIQDPEPKQSISVNGVISIHSALIEQLRAAESQFADQDYENQNPYITGGLGFHHEQREYYKLEPLFRALLVIIDEPTIDATTQQVHLVRTGVTTGLGTPVSFQSFGQGNGDVVTVTLAEAVDFVLDLEQREKEA